MEEEITKRKQVEEVLQKQKFELGERIKELNCFYGISEIAKDYSLSLDEMLQRIVELIPLSLQYPETTHARIMFERQGIFGRGNSVKAVC